MKSIFSFIVVVVFFIGCGISQDSRYASEVYGKDVMIYHNVGKLAAIGLKEGASETMHSPKLYYADTSCSSLGFTYVGSKDEYFANVGNIHMLGYVKLNGKACFEVDMSSTTFSGDLDIMFVGVRK